MNDWAKKKKNQKKEHLDSTRKISHKHFNLNLLINILK
jgi:hypothetical protein